MITNATAQGFWISFKTFGAEIFLREKFEVCITHGVQKMLGNCDSIIKPTALHTGTFPVTTRTMLYGPTSVVASISKPTM